MTVKLREQRRFDRSSPVTRYWLAHCEGFRIAGSSGGRVEELVAELDDRRPVELLVRSRSGRRRVVSADAVDAVVPAERLLIVNGAADGHRRIDHAGERSVAVARQATSTSWTLGVRAAADARPRLQRLAGATFGSLAALSMLLLRLARAFAVLALRSVREAGHAVEDTRNQIRERRAQAGYPARPELRRRQHPPARRPFRQTNETAAHTAPSRRTSNF
jgi:hypothetical protein